MAVTPDHPSPLYNKWTHDVNNNHYHHHNNNNNHNYDHQTNHPGSLWRQL